MSDPTASPAHLPGLPLTEVGAFIDAVASEVPETFGISSRLRKPLDGDPEVGTAVEWAFAYQLLFLNDPRVVDGMDPYEPLAIRTDGASYPPFLADIDDATLAVWAGLLPHVSHPFAVARLADLLWCRRFGDKPYPYAIAAHDAALGAAQRVADAIDAVPHVQRAAVISRELNDADRQDQTGSVIESMLDAEIATSAPSPGVVFGFIRAAGALNGNRCHDAIERAARRILETSTGNDPWNCEQALETLAALAPAAERRPFYEQIVRIWSDRAGATDGITRDAFHRKAIDAAQRYDLIALRNEAALRQQQRPIRLDELAKISTPVELPEPVIDWIESTADLDGWEPALSRLLGLSPLAGKADDVLKQATEVSTSSLLGIFDTIVSGPEGMVIAHIPGGLAGAPQRARQHHGQVASITASLAARLLATATDAFGPPTPDQLVSFFHHGIVTDAGLAEAFSRSVVHHAEGRFDEAIHIAFPRIETVIRSTARDAGILVNKPPTATTEGGVATLGAILENLRGILDEDVRITLRTVLTDPLGMNLRNLYAHGLGGVGNEAASTAVIYIAVLLSRFIGTPEPPSPGVAPETVEVPPPHQS